jgi:hypothetical protein
LNFIFRPKRLINNLLAGVSAIHSPELSRMPTISEGGLDLQYHPYRQPSTTSSMLSRNPSRIQDTNRSNQRRIAVPLSGITSDTQSVTTESQRGASSITGATNFCFVRRIAISSMSSVLQGDQMPYYSPVLFTPRLQREENRRLLTITLLRFNFSRRSQIRTHKDWLQRGSYLRSYYYSKLALWMPLG